MSRYSLLLLACALAVASCFVANGAPLRGERLHQADSPLCMVSVARCGGLRRLQKKKQQLLHTAHRSFRLHSISDTCFLCFLFNAAAPSAQVSRAVEPVSLNKAPVEAAVAAVAGATTLLASNAGDFGGYTIPIIGLGVLAATIGILAGPVED